MADALLNLRNRAFKKDFKEKFLFKVFKHSLLYRMKHYFGKWKHNNERLALAEQINVSFYQIYIFMITYFNTIIVRGRRGC